MAKMLLQTKRDYMDYIAKYMYENHISYKTLEQTKKTWRTERAYDTMIEEELISVSKLFISLLRHNLDLNFRRRLVNFMANYLAVYTSKSKEYANITDARARHEHAYVKLNNNFLVWLNSTEQIKAAHKPRNTQTPQKPRTEKAAPKHQKHILKQDGKIIQEITFGDEKVSFTYEDLAEYRKKCRADFARTVSAHTK